MYVAMPLSLNDLLKFSSFCLSRISTGRLLGGWLGLAMTPLSAMIKWIFSPYLSLGSLSVETFSVAMLLQFQEQIHRIAPQILLGRILPQLILCLVVCVAMSSAFSWLGHQLEERIRCR